MLKIRLLTLNFNRKRTRSIICFVFRLRELLLSEEVAYTNEYIAKCQEAAASKDEEMKRKAFDLKTKLERERQDLVQQKLQERKM